jgi:hypothetical protein|tara:strand:- start:5030 stop:5239 length:210 start_codon:yes stop_codon:yes gene_type:complete
MNTKHKKEYEVLNVNTGKWEQKTMSEAEYDALINDQEQNLEAIEAEYQIISKIISQQIGLEDSNLESRD